MSWHEIGFIMLLCIVSFVLGHGVGYGNAKSARARQDARKQSRGEVK
jgi:hypothetical protein